MSSNYPPGVTGNEPHLTGIPDINPHEPFNWQEWEGDDPERRFWVHFGPDEDPMFGPFALEAEADALARTLNRSYAKRDCDIDGTSRLPAEAWGEDGHTVLAQCRICGDLIPEPEE